MQAHPRIDIAILIIGLAVFATIALINAPRASIWFDEAFSAYIIQFSFWEIAQFTASDVHPPLYYWALKVWSLLFGTTDFALRSLSVLFAGGAIAGTFVLVRQLLGRSVAAVSLLFLALSPMLIRYSDEMRMYTMAALIVVLATYVLVRAMASPKEKKWWVWYAVLVALGMWTHYFTALVWLAHWAWRAGVIAKTASGVRSFMKQFFSKAWILTHVLAVGIFLPWLVIMATQFGVIQSAGFWIGPVGVDTPVNFVTNIFYYLSHGQTQSWVAVVLIAVVGLVAWLLPRTYRTLKAAERKWAHLMLSLAFVPPMLLFILSLPPLRPLYVDRYLVPSTIFVLVFVAIVLVVGTKAWKPVWRAVPIVAVVGMLVFGVTNVYYYGNYNKSTSTHIFSRQVVEQIREVGEPGQPIVANSPWILYETAPYETPDHQVYFIDANTSYDFGSLEMLKNSDLHKIKDMDAFETENPVIWYIGANSDEVIAPYSEDWVALQTVSVTDEISGKTLYKATQYQVSAE